MKLSKLLDVLSLEVENNDVEINEITSNSNNIVEGCLFVCIKGQHSDGHDFAKYAIQKGAAAVICEYDVGVKNQYIYKDAREALALVTAKFFNNPMDKLKLIGITGTNGKTTVSSIIKHILSCFHEKSGLIGTVCNDTGQGCERASQTTPEPYALYKLFEKMVERECKYAVMEISSHALAQKRLAGCTFETAVFTNFTQDHLDYHLTMENYFQAKASLFNMAKTAVLNADDSMISRLFDVIKIPYKTFSLTNENADFFAKNIEMDVRGVKFDCIYKYGDDFKIATAKFCMPGDFSILNALASVAVMVMNGYDFYSCVAALSSFEGVKGRTEFINTNKNFSILIDYAHSPDGLEKILQSVKGFASGRVVLVFGCGGNRDKTKRPQMAQVAAKYADYIYLTSDNPRNEDPFDILQDVENELKKYDTPYEVYVDRYYAIKMSIENARVRDVIILAGKGHEDYQILKNKTIDFDEEKIVKEILSENT